MTRLNTQTLGATAASPSAFFLNGNNGYVFNAGRVTLHADEVNSPGNFAGELSLQLWALDELFDGQQLLGKRIASLPLGLLLNGNCFTNIAEELEAQLPVDGSYQMILALVETYNEIEYLHDWRGYAQPETFAQALIESPFEPIASTEVMAEAETPAEMIAEDVAEAAIALGNDQPPMPSAAESVVTPNESVTKEAVKRKAETIKEKSSTSLKKAPKRAVSASKSATKKTAKPRATIVNINKDSSEVIATLRGVSSNLAGRIVVGRPYQQKQDLLQIKGIGKKMLETISAQIKL